MWASCLSRCGPLAASAARCSSFTVKLLADPKGVLVVRGGASEFPCGYAAGSLRGFTNSLRTLAALRGAVVDMVQDEFMLEGARRHLLTSHPRVRKEFNRRNATALHVARAIVTQKEHSLRAAFARQ